MIWRAGGGEVKKELLSGQAVHDVMPTESETLQKLITEAGGVQLWLEAAHGASTMPCILMYL